MAKPDLPTGDAYRTCVSEGECRPAHRSSKNTRDFCKGREGIPHAWLWERWRHEIQLEQLYGGTWNRVTECQVCFGCGKRRWEHRSYCRLCGEPWPLKYWWSDRDVCRGCGVSWRVSVREKGA